MKCYIGTIITLNKNNDVYRYLVEDSGKIVFLGDELPSIYKDIEKVVLGKHVLMPSFCDSHQHFASFAMFNSGLNVMDAESNTEIKNWIKKYAEKSRAKLLIAFGASPYSVAEKTLLSKKDLDEVCPHKPIAVIKYDGHACIVNSKLLKKIYKKASKLRGFHADTGEMNQEAFFAVSNYISSSLSIPALLKSMQKAVDYEAAKGIGMVHSVSGVGFPLNIDITLEKIFGKSIQGGFQYRVFPQDLNIKTATARKLPRIGGCFKCALDGCFGSQDAAVKTPYLDGTDGVLYYTDEQVIDFCKKANRAGLQIEMHAIGDKAFDQASRALKAALDDQPRQDHRHGIIHCCLPTAEGIKICRDYNIQMPIQSSFINWKQEPNEYLETILGDRVNQLNPLKTFVDTGIMISAGSDAPCTDPDPIQWIYKACNNGDQSLTIEQALKMCTYNGYWTTFDDGLRGSLEVGKVADMVILSDNPYGIEKNKLNKLKVLDTILNGESYKQQHQSVLALLIKGIFSRRKI